MHRKVAFLFPGQGAQYPGMGKEFAQTYPEAKQTYEEAEDILQRKITSLIFDGSESELKETRNSQIALFVTSIAVLRVLQKLYPFLQPSICAGLSLGEYTALTASQRLSFADCLPLVAYRAQFMNEACETNTGSMAVVLGLPAIDLEQMVSDLRLPNELWIANYNSPGQIVLSGTLKGIEAGIEAAKGRGAKRVLPLQVHGAFHSGLMKEAEKKLAPYIQEVSLLQSPIELVMNVPGDFVIETKHIKENLIKQVSSSVRWEQGIRAIEKAGVELYLEIGCGKTLAGLNKQIGVKVPTLTIDKIEDLKSLDLS